MNTEQTASAKDTNSRVSLHSEEHVNQNAYIARLLEELERIEERRCTAVEALSKHGPDAAFLTARPLEEDIPLLLALAKEALRMKQVLQDVCNNNKLPWSRSPEKMSDMSSKALSSFKSSISPFLKEE